MLLASYRVQSRVFRIHNQESTILHQRAATKLSMALLPLLRPSDLPTTNRLTAQAPSPTSARVCSCDFHALLQATIMAANFDARPHVKSRSVVSVAGGET